MKHAPSVVNVSRQQQEHGDTHLIRQFTSSSDNGRSMVITPQVCNMPRQLTSSHDNGQSMVFDLEGKKHALKFVIVS